jgi:hypothetical protein
LGPAANDLICPENSNVTTGGTTKLGAIVDILKDDPALEWKPLIKDLSFNDTRDIALGLIENHDYHYKVALEGKSKQGEVTEKKEPQASEIRIAKQLLTACVMYDRSHVVTSFGSDQTAEDLSLSFLHEVFENRGRLYALFLEYKRDLFNASKLNVLHPSKQSYGHALQHALPRDPPSPRPNSLPLHPHLLSSLPRLLIPLSHLL